MSRNEDWWKLLATGRPGFRGTCAVLWRSWACLAQAGSCAVSEKYRGCSNQAAAAQQNHTANRVIKTVAVVFGCHHIRSRTNSSASRSEDWWKLLATGRPGFRGTCAVFRDERTTRPATATRVSEVTPLCLFLSHGQASFPGRPPSSRYFNHHLRRAGTRTDTLTHPHTERRRGGGGMHESHVSGDPKRHHDNTWVQTPTAQLFFFAFLCLFFCFDVLFALAPSASAKPQFPPNPRHTRTHTPCSVSMSRRFSPSFFLCREDKLARFSPSVAFCTRRQRRGKAL